MIRLEGKADSRTVLLNDKALTPGKSQALRNHSPDGFAWGYGGSGPSQLALAILLEAGSVDNALEKYQDFKWEIIAELPRTDFIEEIDLDKWCT